jgi:hypothetical protein
MPLIAATLATGLEAMTPTADEDEAIGRFVDAWELYFNGSQLGAAAAIPGSYAAALASLRSSLSGWSADGAASGKIQTGLTQFWTTLAPLASAVWIQIPPLVTTPPATPPLTLSGIKAALDTQFAANVDAESSLKDAAAGIADVLHLNGGIGGICVITAVPAPPPPVTVPIT